MRKLTTSEFIERAHLVHGNKYDYSKSDYKGIDMKIEIICQIHGSFYQTPYNHLAGHDCNRCSGKLGKHIQRAKKLAEDFIIKAKLVHGNRYDYSKAIYKTAKETVIIICPIHGGFLQTPDSHLSGHGCTKCSIDDHIRDQVDDKYKFIEKSRLIHGDKYDYSLVEYVNNRTKVCIICQIHGEFWQMPYNHLASKGCPSCVNLINSKGQKATEEFFKTNNIIYNRQRSFDDCRNPETNRKLFFDFYLPNLNICVEYDGRQHFIQNPHWGGEIALIETKNVMKLKIITVYLTI